MYDDYSRTNYERFKPCRRSRITQKYCGIKHGKKYKIDGTEVGLEVVLTIQGCPLKAKIQQDIEDSLRNIGASKVSLTFGSMTPEERAALTASLKKEARTETGMPSMLRPDSGVRFIT